MTVKTCMLVALLAAGNGCRTISDRPVTADSAAADSARRVADSAGTPSAGPPDTGPATGVSAAQIQTPGADSSLPPLRLADSVNAPAPLDTTAVRLYPAEARRGGVMVVRIPAAGTAAPRCSWKGAPLPCYRAGADVRAIVPFPADEPAGSFPLTVEAGGGTFRQTVPVAEDDFGRQLVFLDSAHYALIRQGTAVARDARALRGVLASESPGQRWTGWRNPGAGAKAAGYGVERFYFRASDSSRVVSLGTALRSTGSFGLDTAVAKASDAPAWRHAGVDIPLGRRTPVRAAAAGSVVAVGEYILTGRTVVVDHGEGVHTAYFHLDSAAVRQGDSVRRGDVVGRVGATGLATGPHLHYGVYVHGKDVDPAAWHALPAAALVGGGGTAP